ncbi:hypothetical protein [Frankia sp. AvcI1]|uniref:hypothetical protein n=1 Tax=Frankia sp. AvcI1 TaxID=573496 RepID=UPI0006EBF1AD|nr:hypothetical protein [Frankia sp. AvcI1]
MTIDTEQIARTLEENGFTVNTTPDALHIHDVGLVESDRTVIHEVVAEAGRQIASGQLAGDCLIVTLA